MRAGFLLSLTEPSLLAEAATHLQRARALSAQAPPRERAHLEAVQLALDGRWQAACRAWDELLVEYPRDALALQWAQLWDFYRGDAVNLRLRPARALPEWDEADPLHAHVLSLYAFGLEESNLYPQAEDIGRRSLAANPKVPWAVHAVAHVMEMQGRYEEGGAWLRQHQSAWADGNGFSGHLWWHKGLFRLEAMDLAGALRLLDTRLSGAALQITLQRVDAAALLWRLHLLGVDVASRCAELLAAWDLSEAAAGYYAFNDVHAVLAMLGAGEVARAEAWVARCAERAMVADDARRSNHGMAREVGLPLMRGLLAFARGQADAAADALYAARGVAQRFGGSHAQRDVIDQTLLCAAARGTRRGIGRALINERIMAKPSTPLTAHWQAQLDLMRDAVA
jgi:tetratricopeptide (TPR) repeat protein